jgi:hypothetical protein
MKKEIFNKKFKAIVNSTINELKERLYLTDWKIMIRYSNTNSAIDEKGERNLASIRPSYVYSNAILTIYPSLIDETKHDSTILKDVLCHEMVHCLTDEALTLANGRFTTPPELHSANERLVQKITRVIEWKHSPKTNDIKKTRIKNNKVPSKKIQVPKGRHGSGHATGVHNIKPRKGKVIRTLSMRWNQNKKDRS